MIVGVINGTTDVVNERLKNARVPKLIMLGHRPSQCNKIKQFSFLFVCANSTATGLI
jgi:hypothetical protein